MLIEFSQNADYWRKQCDEAVAAGRLMDALPFARKALSLSTDYDTWFAYADLLNEMRQFNMSASVCLRYGPGDTEEERASWAELMADNASLAGNMPAYIHYQMMLIHMAESDDQNFDFGDMLMDFFEHFGEEKSKDKLVFTPEAHKAQNRAVYDRMFEAYRAQRYREVLELAEDIHPDYEFYMESLFLQGMSEVQVGLVEQGKMHLWQMYGLANHDARVLYHMDEIGDGLTEDEMTNALAALPADGNKDNMAVAAILADRHNLKKTALYYARAAYDAAPTEPEHIFRLAAAYANAGAPSRSAQYLKEVVDTYADYFPRMLLEVPFEPPIDVSFDFIPFVLMDELHRYVERMLESDYMHVLMQTDADFRSSVHFLLTTPYDPVRQSKLAQRVAEWLTPEGIAFQRDLLIEPALPEAVQYRLVYGLLTHVRKGKVRITSDYVCDAYQLRVPPSFDDYDDQMRRIYVYAYCEMVRASVHSELKLSRVVERLYLNLPEGYYQANVMGLAVAVAAHIVDKKSNFDDILASREWDAELFAYYLDAVKEALKK